MERNGSTIEELETVLTVAVNMKWKETHPVFFGIIYSEKVPIAILLAA